MMQITLPRECCECWWSSDDGQGDMLAGVGRTPEDAVADAERELASADADVYAGGGIDDGQQISRSAWDAISARLYADGHDDAEASALHRPDYDGLVAMLTRLGYEIA